MHTRQDYIDAANTALGVLAAKASDDTAAVEFLMRSFHDDATMASGFLLAAEALLGILSAETELEPAALVRMATLLIENGYPEPPIAP